MSSVEHITTGAIFTSWVFLLAYLVIYAVTAPFWRSATGRTMYSLGAVLFAIATLAVAGQLFGQDYAARPIARLLVWTATAAVTLGLLVALSRAQLRRKDDDE